MFFWNSLCFFDDSMDIGNLISGSSAFSKSSLNIWKFMVHRLLKPGLENFKHYFGEGNGNPLQYSWASLVAQPIKNLPAMQETWVRSLGWKDPLEKGMAVYSTILAQRILWTEEPSGLQSMAAQRVGHD